MVFLGVDNSKLHKAFEGYELPIADVRSMEACVKACNDFAQEGDTVLLSPCCASFDLFQNMADRGNQFNALVTAI